MAATFIEKDPSQEEPGDGTYRRMIIVAELLEEHASETGSEESQQRAEGVRKAIDELD